MTDSMQFGPEWLRNLSQNDNDNTMVMPKYQLAEHRYGREEMLALFDKTVAAPEPLRSISGLYVEKIQLPLALIQMSEEETRVWNSNAAHDNNPRGLNKTMPGNMMSMSPLGGVGLSRGRGSSVDRGRGRGSRGPYHYNNRNYSEDNADSTHPNTTFGRPRIFDRSQSHTSERNWSERNGNAEYNDWNGYNNNVENGLSTSPRKDFGSAMRTASSREDTNWRRRPAKDDDDTWRSTRHGRGYTNWREGGERDREKEKDQDGPEPGKDRRWMSRVVSMHVSGHPNRRNSECREDILPEWATESPSEGGGSFDSSGAFHGSNSDDEEHERRDKLKSEPDRTPNKRDDRKTEDNRSNRAEQKSINDQKKNKVKEKSSSPSINESLKSKQFQDADIGSSPPSIESGHSLSQLKKSVTPQSTASTENYLAHMNNAKDLTSSPADAHKSSQSHKLHHDLPHAPMQGGIDMMNNTGFDSNFSMNHRDSNHYVANYQNLPNSSGNNSENKVLISPADIVNNTLSMMNSKDGSKSASSINPLNTIHGFNMSSSNIRMKGKEEELDGIVGDVVSKIMEEEEKVEAIKRLENINKWFYRDPQGVVQGPFTSSEMAEWYRLGYFHDKSLLVRRSCENQYYPLHDLVTLFGGAPFENITLQNINTYARLPMASASPAAVPPIAPNIADESLLYYQQQLQLRTLFARHQQDMAVQNAIRQLSQNERWKSLPLLEQQRLVAQHVSNNTEANTAIPQVSVPQPSVPIMPGYMHPTIPQTLPPSTNPALVLLLTQMQQQQQQQQQQPPPPPPQTPQHHHLQQQMHLHQQLHQQQNGPQQGNQEVKPDRVPPNLLQQLDPLQQLVVKMNNMQTSNQVPLVPPQSNNMQIPLSNSLTQPITTPSSTNNDTQSNPIHNLLKQLGVNTEKPAKVDSVWGPSPTSAPSVPLLNNNAFNPQHWLSQVGRIGPNNSPNNGLWTAEGVPTTTAMKTEQQIIESLMKDMERKQEESRIDSGKLLEMKKEEIRLQQEELLRRTAEEKKKKEIFEKKLEEEKKQKLEEEKRKKQIQEEERFKKLEEEKRKKSVEDAKRKEEERRRKEDEKKRKEEEKDQKRKVEDDRKKQEQKRKETEELQRKQAESLRRLKEQQLNASGNSKPSLKSVTSATNEQDGRQMDAMPKLAKQNSTLSNKAAKLADKQNAEQVEKTSGGKQISKSKSSPSVPTQGQKGGESEKKEKKKKEKAPVNAWDQKKAPNVKSLAEIQAEEQKQLAKQIEREKAERLLLQQQAAAAAALAAKENATGNIWNSQSVPWKNSPTWASSPTPPAAALASSRSEASVASKAWNEPSRTASNIALNAKQQNTANNTSNLSKPIANSINAATPQHQKATGNATKTVKPKKEDTKKTAPAAAVVNKNDELSKWGIKALSCLKPTVDVPTFISFLRDVESPNDVMEYVADYLGDGKEAKNFVKQFLERRSVLVSGSCGSMMMSSTTFTATVMSTVGGSVKKMKKKPADETNPNSGSSASKSTSKQPASKQNSMEFTEVKGKVKKGKKKATRLDNALLGFNVTAAPDRFNIGDRDSVEDLY